MWELNSAKVSLGPDNHGITFKLNGTKPQNESIYGISLDIHGNIWNDLPTGIETLAKW
jgi:hypothetical protein